MVTTTFDRFGRVVIPIAMRRRHGWVAGSAVELREGPHGVELMPVADTQPLPAGCALVDGLVVCTGTPIADITDIDAIRQRLDAERDQELGGMR